MNEVSVAIYVRVSTSAQDLEGQERAMREDAKERGWTVVEVYREKITATGNSTRDEYERAQRDMADPERPWSVLSCWALDRWSRDARIFKAVDEVLESEKRFKVRFHFVEETILDTPIDGGESLARDMLLGTLGIIAKWEARRTAERTRIAMAELKAGRRQTKTGNPWHRPRKVSLETEERIVHLKDAEGLPWSKVAQKVRLPKGTCSRVYSQYKRGVSEVPGSRKGSRPRESSGTALAPGSERGSGEGATAPSEAETSPGA